MTIKNSLVLKNLVIQYTENYSPGFCVGEGGWPGSYHYDFSFKVLENKTFTSFSLDRTQAQKLIAFLSEELTKPVKVVEATKKDDK